MFLNCNLMRFCRTKIMLFQQTWSLTIIGESTWHLLNRRWLLLLLQILLIKEPLFLFKTKHFLFQSLQVSPLISKLKLLAPLTKFLHFNTLSALPFQIGYHMFQIFQPLLKNLRFLKWTCKVWRKNFWQGLQFRIPTLAICKTMSHLMENS